MNFYGREVELQHIVALLVKKEIIKRGELINFVDKMHRYDVDQIVELASAKDESETEEK